MISGKAYWFKAQGSPKANRFNPDIPQWTFDLAVDDENAQKLLELGMKKTYLRNKDDERGTFISFARDAVKKDKSPGKPFNIVDAQGKPWDNTKNVGNGSELNVVVSLNERTFRGDTFLKPSAVAIQVWNLVKYDSGAFPTKAAEPEQEGETEW